MFVFGNLIGTLANLLDFAMQALMLVLLVNAILSWFPGARGNPVAEVLERVSGVVCDPVRRAFPTAFGGIDFAPLLVMILLQFVGRGFVVPTLHDLAFRMR